MLNRRQFLSRSLKASSLVALAPAVPQFLLNTAAAAEPGRDNILVVIELTGGNDGLNTVIPYGDDLYHKYRPTLRYTKDQVVKIDDYLGLHPALRPLEFLLGNGQLAIVQGIGYPNPNRSHFESMDIWQSAEVGRKLSGTGWLARGVAELQDKDGNIPIMHLGPENLPLALRGAASGVVSINDKKPFRLRLDKHDRLDRNDAIKFDEPVKPVEVSPEAPVDEAAKRRQKRLQLMRALAPAPQEEDPNDLLAFVQRRQIQTFDTLSKLEELLPQTESNRFRRFFNRGDLADKLDLVAELINRGFGGRVYYVTLDGFDTHSSQAETHRDLLEKLARGISEFYDRLNGNGQSQRVVTMTFSEFGRRVDENGSQGTDHGAASCLFVAGPAVKGGPIGKHPSLSDLGDGDLKYHTDFRRLYATLLDQWLGCDSQAILGGQFEHLELLKVKS
ncbi:MAG: DUF1501 domain-containing protein [Gemmataceae bacterium]